MLKTFYRVGCDRCGVVFEVEEGELAGDAVRCPHCGALSTPKNAAPVEYVVLQDCEIRDWERIGMLSNAVQDLLLKALESGRAPRELLPIIAKLRDVGALICL
ncbi:hypothetical protein [Pyrobaculum ferrireducens]|uniref:Uncharacterized protein n=1 Tax=Pyrobaculum ferrireducens TaxID=1104324 RepID=G7VD12_9CREN|nr:hypothetical protein P186_2505 [Pyrobaculum ferrireducens]